MNRIRVADLFTLGNLGAGFFAILSDNLLFAAGLICLGAVLDVFDGWVARKMNQSSDLGVQLDSLADMVTFGVAPAILFYRMMPEGWLTLVVCVLIPITSAWRLAAFNLLPPSPWFRGLPTPTNALWYVGLALWLPGDSDWPLWLISPTIHLVISLSLSALMVSSMPILGMKSKAVIQRSWWIIVAAMLGLILPVITGHFGLAICSALIFFLIASIINALAVNTQRKIN